LREMRGISEAEFAQRFGKELFTVYGEVIDKYLSLGLLAREKGRIFLTREGIDVSNVIFTDFITLC
nr:coproporphyrinogen III oxidase [Lachnospiraceae bacterium]